MPAKQTRRSGLLGWLTHSDVPIFVLDSKRRIRFINQGCEAFFNCDADELIGKICTYSSEDAESKIDQILQRLGPPPDVMEGAEAEVPMSFELVTGTKESMLVHYLPLTEADGTNAVLGWIKPLESASQHSVASQSQMLHAELANLRIVTEQRFLISNLISESDSMKRVMSQMEFAKSSNGAVHFSGEQGTGREAIARSIHHQSQFNSKVFVPIDCRRLPAREIKKTIQRVFAESQSNSQSPDSFQPGVLFLRDVHLLKRELQVQLVEGVASQAAGDSIRMMSSSSENLKLMLERDELESSFFYLITPLIFEIPALRDRRNDIPLLSQAFLEEQNRYSQKQVSGFSTDVLENWQRYNWPGNLIELKAVIAEICDQFEGSGVIGMKEMPFRFRTGWDAQAVGPTRHVEPVLLEDELAEFETKRINEALELSKGNKSQAAKLLGMTRPKFYRRLEALGLIKENTESQE